MNLSVGSEALRTVIKCFLVCTLFLFVPAEDGASALNHMRGVFAHYVMCCHYSGGRPTVDELGNEIDLAIGLGLDGFILNIGAWRTESHYRADTDNFFDAAEHRDERFKLFISADASTGLTPTEVSEIVEKYHNRRGYYHINGRPVLTTFGGSPEWVKEIQSKLLSKDIDTFLLPKLTSSQGPQQAFDREKPPQEVFERIFAENTWLDGLSYFGAAGRPAEIVRSSFGAYNAARNAAKTYMAPVSPWYRGHGKNNRVFDYGGFEGLITEWRSAARIADIVEVVTWNDWGESSYVRPFSKISVAIWGGNWGLLPSHSGFSELLRYYIAERKLGRSPDIQQNEVYMFVLPASGDKCGDPGLALPCPSGSAGTNDVANFFVKAVADCQLCVRADENRSCFNVKKGASFFDVKMSGSVRKIGISFSSDPSFEKITDLEGLNALDHFNPLSIAVF